MASIKDALEESINERGALLKYIIYVIDIYVHIALDTFLKLWYNLIKYIIKDGWNMLKKVEN